MFHKGLYITPAENHIKSSVPKEFLAFCFINQKSVWRELYVYLDLPTWVSHLLIGLRHLLGISWLDSYQFLLPKNEVKPCYRALIISLPELDPEGH